MILALIGFGTGQGFLFNYPFIFCQKILGVRTDPETSLRRELSRTFRMTL